MAYAWIIDNDELWLAGIGDEPEVGAIGPYGAPDHLLEKLAHGDGIVFQLWDDDGEHYYTGRVVSDEPFLSPDSLYAGDEPLVDYGRPNAGCTEIRYPEYPELDCS